MNSVRKRIYPVGAGALERLAAVDLLRRSIASFDAVCFRTGCAGPESAPFARTSDAAVGAKSPVCTFGRRGEVVCGGVLGREAEGVLGRELEGVLGRELEGVLGREGVTDAREEAREAFDGVGLIGPGALSEDMEADMDRLEWKDDGGEFAGVRTGGFTPVVLVWLPPSWTEP